jgi:hypothetical protein
VVLQQQTGRTRRTCLDAGGRRSDDNVTLQRRCCGTLAGRMHPPPPGFIRISITSRACWREDVLDMQRGGIMTPERLRRSWRRCAEFRSGDIEIAQAEAAHNLPGKFQSAASDNVVSRTLFAGTSRLLIFLRAGLLAAARCSPRPSRALGRRRHALAFARSNRCCAGYAECSTARLRHQLDTISHRTARPLGSAVQRQNRAARQCSICAALTSTC